MTGDLAQHGPEIEALAQPLAGAWYSGAQVTTVENEIKSTLVSMVMPGRR